MICESDGITVCSAARPGTPTEIDQTPELVTAQAPDSSVVLGCEAQCEQHDLRVLASPIDAQQACVLQLDRWACWISKKNRAHLEALILPKGRSPCQCGKTLMLLLSHKDYNYSTQRVCRPVSAAQPSMMLLLQCLVIIRRRCWKCPFLGSVSLVDSTGSTHYR